MLLQFCLLSVQGQDVCGLLQQCGAVEMCAVRREVRMYVDVCRAAQTLCAPPSFFFLGVDVLVVAVTTTYAGMSLPYTAAVQLG